MKMLVPTMLREKLSNAKIGFFLHTPFPSSEIFRCLPSIFQIDLERKEILSGALGATLIGFQTYSYARHFISSCTRVLGCESSTLGVTFNDFLVNIGIFPIGINLQNVEKIM
jgi:trehalose-6-phosphate synthase